MADTMPDDWNNVEPDRKRYTNASDKAWLRQLLDRAKRRRRERP